MRFQRSSGILLHPTSLPGRFGIGDLGENAYKFVDMLVECNQKLWQICPLGPTGYGDSPYQCFSAFAGNPLLISLDKLMNEGFLTRDDFAIQTPFDDHNVDFGRVIHFKYALLWRAYERFSTGATSAQHAKFETFCQRHRDWLEDYALFMALKAHHNGAAWNTWEWDLINRNPATLEYWRKQLVTQLAYQKFLQYIFFDQWLELKAYANRYSVKIVGDIPIFVAFDSADAWAHRDLFLFDQSGNPTFVAGVPPDYFSPTGQLWGNPLYRWNVMKERGYQWWIDRFMKTFELVDIVRLDHFRGFAAYWSVPFGEPNAIRGNWEPGPGKDFFAAVEHRLGKLPIIAEDLGVITPDVTELREAFEFPGMKILQFAFDSKEDNNYLPHTYAHNCVVYTGTHDNDTTLGWYTKCAPHDREWVNRYLHTDGRDICWDFMRAAWSSVADMAIIPLQDLLGLGSEARMNTPATTGKNWKWRFTWEMIKPENRDRLRTMTKTYWR
jgi:4-alpha-glucanotransferase